MVILIFMSLTPNSKINYYKKEIKELKENNKKLRLKYDSINIRNIEIVNEINRLNDVINVTEKLIVQYDNRIKDLKNNKNETANKVNALNADGVAIEFTNYLKKRRN